ncbi:titin-like [Hylaeus volcanicus]|uniref:titin-like n=1 Tax=Hylaeus volcanicus TaxID=313075 RepID=UPI0023B7EFEB|nr:titin-like [Hylaeus volcanicus]
MLHRPECRKYRQWKLERSKKSRQAVKKEKELKHRDSITDCIEEDETNNTSEDKQKIVSPKCKKKIRISRKPRTTASYVLKRVSLTEIVLKKIQPSIEVREQLINPRHVICLDDSEFEIDFPLEIPETTISLLKYLFLLRTFTGTPYQTCRPRWRPKGRKRRRRIAKKTVKGDKKEQPGEEKEEGEPDEGEPEEGEPEAEENVKDKGARKILRRKTKKKKRKKKVVDTDSEEDSECDSICSFDSHVCLAGLKLTAEDKNKIKEYQRQVEDANTEGNVAPTD